MREADVIRLQHMLDMDTVREAIEFVYGRTRSDLNSEGQLVLASVKGIEIIGETVYQVTPDTCHQIIRRLPQSHVLVLASSVREDPANFATMC